MSPRLRVTVSPRLLYYTNPNSLALAAVCMRLMVKSGDQVRPWNEIRPQWWNVKCGLQKTICTVTLLY